MLALTATRLALRGEEVDAQPVGPLVAYVAERLARVTPGGLVVLGTFGSGKTHLCDALASGALPGAPPCTVVPLRLVAQAPSPAEGLMRVAGAGRLAQAQAGERVLLLDGLDEVPSEGEPERFLAFFDAVTQLAGPRWLLTTRPGHVRTEPAGAPDQVDTLTLPHVETIVIDPLPVATVVELLSHLPGGRHRLENVEGLAELARTPMLLWVVQAALPHIEPGRPILPWGVFDAWIRYALTTGQGHDAVVARLTDLAWTVFREQRMSPEAMRFSSDLPHRLNIPTELRRALMVTELDGQLRFGHRSVFEFLLARHIAPALVANQGHGPDLLSGCLITEATRTFLVGQVAPPPLHFEGDRVLIPRGNFIAGGDRSLDERPLRIQHLAKAAWIARAPVTNADWDVFLDAHPGERDRQDAWYLARWGRPRVSPRHERDAPVINIWPEDADRYAAWAGARLPTADEWEKAVRGVDGRRYPWGDTWRAGEAVTAELGVDRPLPVRALGAQGPAQLYSAVGNAFETTASYWRDRPERGRVVMGGAFTHPGSHARPSLRLSHQLSGALRAGLRLAWDA